jgi:hypothetical protein
MTPRRTAIAVWLVTIALCATAATLLVATAGVPMPASWGFRGSSNLVALTFGSVGAVVSIRRPTHTIGWLFLAVGVLYALEALGIEYVVAGVLAIPGSLPLVTPIAWFLTWGWIPPVALALVYLPLLFPDGRLPSRRWRPVVWFGVAATIAFSVLTSVEPGPIVQATFIDNPAGLVGLDDAVFALVLVPFVLAVLLSVVSLVRRFRAASATVRGQIKWFALASLVALVVDAVYSLSFAVTVDPAVTKALEVLLIVAILGLPVAAGLAILRYRLYDIDRIVSRTIAYAAVVTILGAAFVGIILGLQAVLAPITGGQTIAVAASTLAVFALFQPVLRRVRAAVDRRFDRTRYDADMTVRTFATRLRGDVDLSTVSAEIVGTAASAVRPAAAGIWLRTKAGPARRTS